MYRVTTQEEFECSACLTRETPETGELPPGSCRPAGILVQICCGPVP